MLFRPVASVGKPALQVSMVLLAALTVMPIRINGAEVSVVLRFDDYGGETVTEFDRKLVRICETYGMPITIGVVPFMGKNVEDPAAKGEIPLAAEKVDILLNLVRTGKVEIAQHGYSHQTRDAHYLSEFDGMPTEEQVERIGKGKKFLEDRFKAQIMTFIPPWNRYDSNTLVALQKSGFKSLSAGTRSSVFSGTDLRVLPWTCDLGQLEQAVQEARRWSERHSIIVAGFHEYDFIEVDAARGKHSFSDLEEIFAWLTKLPDVKALTVSEATSAAEYLTMQTYERHKRNWVVCRFLPPFLVASGNHVYASEGEANRMYATNLVKAAVWYLSIGASVTLACRIAARFCLGRRPLCGAIPRRIFTFLCSGLITLVIAYGCRHLTGNYRELTIAVVGLGALLAIWTLSASVFERNLKEERSY